MSLPPGNMVIGKKPFPNLNISRKVNVCAENNKNFCEFVTRFTNEYLQIYKLFRMVIRNDRVRKMN